MKDRNKENRKERKERHRETVRQTDRPTEKERKTQRDRQSDRQTDRQTDNKHVINSQISGADPGMGRSGPGPLFWQLNHANSAYFGATYQSISTLSPLFFANPGSDPEYEVKLTNSNLREINTLSNMRVFTHSFTPHTHTPPSPHTGHSMQSLVWHIMLRAEFGAPRFAHRGFKLPTMQSAEKFSLCNKCSMCRYIY